MYKITETNERKILQSSGYNWVFDKKTGLFIRTGHTVEDDPEFSPYGPEIADIEISSGPCMGKCPYCYKSNGIGEYKHMNLSTFKEVISRIQSTLTQIAFGITDFYANPDFPEIMRETRRRGIVPNYTTSALDLDEDAVRMTAELCGAVAVSFVDENACLDAVRRFTEAGVPQVNIHFVLAEETFGRAVKLIDKVKRDPRLEKLNAIVFLAYKSKGRNPGMWKPLVAVEEYEEIIERCENTGINCGFDSCSAPMVLRARPKQYEFIEPCESGLFSVYINSDADVYPCSFAEGVAEWQEGIDILGVDDFTRDIWMGEKMSSWRSKLLASTTNCDCALKDTCRACPLYRIAACKKE